MLKQAFEHYIAKHALCQPGDTILLAVSGGMDSMAMWHLFQTSGYTFHIAHVHFGLRDTEADRDRYFVENHARSAVVPCHIRHVQTTAYAKEHKLSVEEAARNLRYEVLLAIAAEHGCNKIATAHHLNDQAETLLLNLTRGTGIKGMSGIPVINGKVIRPLLFAQREEIAAYCGQHGIEFIQDSTNEDMQFRRNYVRHQIIPAFERINPAFIKTMERNAAHFKAADHFAQIAIHKLLKKWIVRHHGDMQLPVKPLLHHPYTLTILYTWLSPYGFREDQCMQIADALLRPGKVFHTDLARLITGSRHLILCDNAAQDVQTLLLEKKQATIISGGVSMEISLIKNQPGLQVQNSAESVFFDADLLQWPLMLRGWCKGDYMYPAGLFKKDTGKPAKKKVSDIFTDAKWSLRDKEQAIILLSGEHIIWVLALRSDIRFQVSEHTKTVARFRLKEHPFPTTKK